MNDCLADYCTKGIKVLQYNTSIWLSLFSWDSLTLPPASQVNKWTVLIFRWKVMSKDLLFFFSWKGEVTHRGWPFPLSDLVLVQEPFARRSFPYLSRFELLLGLQERWRHSFLKTLWKTQKAKTTPKGNEIVRKSKRIISLPAAVTVMIITIHDGTQEDKCLGHQNRRESIEGVTHAPQGIFRETWPCKLLQALFV